MNLQKIPSLVLAVALQAMPICRVAYVNTGAAPSGFAIVMRWLGAAVALLGSYHAVSGASAAVVGVAQINPTTQLQTGPVTTNALGTNGQIFAYRIIVTNPGVNPQQAFYKAAPLPPGLTINTNLGGNGDILGTPTAPGAYPLTLTAGNANYSNVVTINITITIKDTGTASAPNITGLPADQTVPVGTNVSFTVTANGTAPLSYSWTFNGSAITDATTSTLQLANVVTNSSGTYSVTVANSAGSKSASATLSVMVPPSVATPPQSLTVTNGGTAQFSVVALGSGNLSYQWQFNGNTLAGATSSSLTLLNAQGTNQGSYTVVVSNPVGTVTSPAAFLTVQSTTSGPFQLSNWVATNGTWSFDVTGLGQTNIVIWSSTDLSHWTPVSTNSAASGTVHFSSPTMPSVEFYRASLSQ
jgi:PKD repeat protein